MYLPFRTQVGEPRSPRPAEKDSCHFFSNIIENYHIQKIQPRVFKLKKKKDDLINERKKKKNRAFSLIFQKLP